MIDHLKNLYLTLLKENKELFQENNDLKEETIIQYSYILELEKKIRDIYKNRDVEIKEKPMTFFKKCFFSKN